jgi:hypothetical protein
MKPVEKVLDRLEGVHESNGSWKALCPAHDDREPSLSVSEGDENKAILHCFGGCEPEEIVAEFGLEMKDLFERNGVPGADRKKFVSTPPENTCLTASPLQPRKLCCRQRTTRRVLKEAGTHKQELSGQAGSPHPLPRRTRPREIHQV